MTPWFFPLQFFSFGYDDSAVSKSAEDFMTTFAILFLLSFLPPIHFPLTEFCDFSKNLSLHLREKRIKKQKTNKSCLKACDFEITNISFSYIA